MFLFPHYSNTLSLKLSEVLEDIGVNEKMVMRRRRMCMLMESLNTIADRSTGDEYITRYILGSQSEGTTTKGLLSDIDMVTVDNYINLMKDWSEWEENKVNLLMIQDENVTPGYCFLQLRDYPNCETNFSDDDEDYVRDRNNRLLVKNSCFNGIREDTVRQGPSNALYGIKGYCDVDIVQSFPCNSSPLHLLEIQGIQGCWSQETIRYAASTRCFVVGTSSKICIYPEVEWRISTSLAERCLIFNLNLTQLRCYVLMKMILKTFLNPRKENGMSSFICKNVLLHCVGNTEKRIWTKNNLFKCLTHCMLVLHSSIQNNNCPHFIIPENNLIAGEFTIEVKRDLLGKISDIVQSFGRFLLRIEIDDISQRLQVKLNTISYIGHDILTADELNKLYIATLNLGLAKEINRYHLQISRFSNNMEKLIQSVYKLTKYSVSGNKIEQIACGCVLPFLYSALGSILVTSAIRRNYTLSTKALMWLSVGLKSDSTSGGLKLATVFYYLGDMYRSEFILRQIERRYYSDTVVPVCGCWPQLCTVQPEEFIRKLSEQSEDSINHIISCCVKFMPIEVNCAPRELQYEMIRSSRDDMPYRSPFDKQWMDLAVIDSLPYLFFLQYKTYGFLQRYQDQQRALINLVVTIETYKNYGHRETALNLLGQCMEQENRPGVALQCYIRSLQQRERNNAAKIHISRLLANYVNQV